MERFVASTRCHFYLEMFEWDSGMEGSPDLDAASTYVVSRTLIGFTLERTNILYNSEYEKMADASN